MLINSLHVCDWVIQVNKDTGIIEAPSTWMGWSIVTLLCCCLPLGIISLIFSALTENANNQGFYSKANKYSRMAAWFNIVGTSIGLMTLACFIIYVLTWHGV